MKSLSIARAYCIETVRQPVYILVVAITAILIFASPWITLFGFGRELQIARESGIAGPVLAGLLIVFLTVPGTLAEEIRNKQILAVLAKPISAWGLLVGRFLGLCTALLLAFAIFWAIFGLSLYLKLGYFEGLSLAAAYYLGFLQVATLAAACLLLSLLLPIPLTVILSFIVFTIGNLQPFLSKKNESLPGLGQWAGEFFLLIFPDLTRLNASFDFAVSRNASLPYLGIASFYVLAYCAVLLFAAGATLSRKEIL